MKNIKNNIYIIISSVILFVMIIFKIAQDKIAYYFLIYLGFNNTIFLVLDIIRQFILEALFFSFLFIGLINKRQISYVILSGINTLRILIFQIVNNIDIFNSIIKIKKISYLYYNNLFSLTIALIFAIVMLIITIAIYKKPQKQKTLSVAIESNNKINMYDELIQYKELLDNGTITQEEFDKAKNEILKL